MNIIEGMNALLSQFSEEFPGAPLVQVVEKLNKQERISVMSKTIGQIGYDGYRGTRINGFEWEERSQFEKTNFENAGNAVAIHVLETACPTSPILAAIKAGMTWEEAVDFTAIERMDAEPADWYREGLNRIAAGSDPVSTALSYLGHNSVEEILEQSGENLKALGYCPACEPAPEAWYHKECAPGNHASSLNTPEPHPTDGQGPAIWDLVIADAAKIGASHPAINDMMDRKWFGMYKYGTHLRANDGRNSMKDGYQEALDRAVYLRKAVEEGYPVRDEYDAALLDVLGHRELMDRVAKQ